jgi:hypothetical protein
MEKRNQLRRIYAAVIVVVILASELVASAPVEAPSIAWLHMLRAASAPNYSGETEEWADGIAVDPAGYLYVAGGSNSYDGAFLTKLNRGGELLWTTLVASAEGLRVAVDGEGNVFMAGRLGGWTIANSTVEIFLAKFDSNGHLQWIVYPEILALVDLWHSMGIATDIYGNLYLSGGARSPTGFHAFLMKFNPLGSLNWSKTWYYTNMSVANSVATDATGNVYVAGYTANDSFLAQFDSDGISRWSRALGENNLAVRIEGLAMGPSGDIYVAANSWSPSGPSAFNSSRVLLAKFAPNGTANWIETFGAQDEARLVYSMTIDAGGDVYLVGNGLLNLTNRSHLEEYLAKFDSGGNLYWDTMLLAGYDVGFVGVGVDHFGNIYVGGSAAGEAPEAIPPTKLNTITANSNLTVSALIPTMVNSGFAVTPLPVSRVSEVNFTLRDGLFMGTLNEIIALQLQQGLTLAASNTTQPTTISTPHPYQPTMFPILGMTAIILTMATAVALYRRKRSRK